MGNRVMCMKKKDVAIRSSGGGDGSRSKRVSRSQRKLFSDEEMLHRRALSMAIHQAQLSQRFDGSISRRVGSTSSRRQTLSDPFSNNQQVPDLVESLTVKKFVLVHGEGFGAWCWYKTVASLEETGLSPVTVDLTGSGFSMADANSVSTLEEYSKPLIELLQNLLEEEKVILVGHSTGGACVSYALERFPEKISKAVFICATMVSDGQRPFDVFADQLGSAERFMEESQFLIHGNGKDKPATGFTFDINRQNPLPSFRLKAICKLLAMQSVREEESSSIDQEPRSCGDNSVWAHVSPLLSAACSDLHEGELIHGDNFNLFAAMSALEIMDPKMDSGMVSTFYSIDEAIESGFAPVPISSDRTVDMQCIIDIMDHLLACEATWHMGHSLAQTVFSCIYVLRPDRTSSHALLHSFCRVIRATCRALVSVLSDARTNEEEDLFTMTYGLPFNGDEDGKGLLLLNAVEETICRQLRACKATSSKRRVLEELEPLQTNPQLEEGFCKALLCRIRFRKHFLHALNCMRRPQGRGLELARKHIAYCIAELESVLSSVEFLSLETVENGKNEMEESTTGSGRHPIGFDPNLNKRLSAPTPPRAIKLLSWKKAIDYYVKLLHNLDQICAFKLEPDLDAVLQFVVQFQKSRPDLVARAHLQLLLVQDGKLYGRDTFLTICARSLALDVTKNHGLHLNEHILQLNQLMINLLKILCANTPWQRRKLGKILNDWSIFNVQMGITVGNMMQQVTTPRTPKNGDKSLLILNHIYGWLEEQIHWVALRFLVLGFDLELYSPSEYCMVYWYMYIILWKLAEKAHFRVLIIVHTEERKAKKKEDYSRDMAREDRISLWVLLLKCQTSLAQGLTVMIAALRNEGMCLKSQGPFNTENEKFVQHFGLLQKASLPKYDAYESFSESTCHARLDYLPVYECFRDAQKMAKEIKVGYANDPDKLAEVVGLEQVAEHNIIAVNLLCQDRSLKVSFEFIHHPHFATAVVRRS